MPELIEIDNKWFLRDKWGDIKPCIDNIPPRKRNLEGRPDNIYLSIDTKFLMKYFNKSRRTIYRWIKSGKLIPTNIDNIVSNKPITTEEKGELSL